MLPLDPESDEPNVRIQLLEPQYYSDTAVVAMADHLQKTLEGTLGNDGFQWKGIDAVPMPERTAASNANKTPVIAKQKPKKIAKASGAGSKKGLSKISKRKSKAKGDESESEIGDDNGSDSVENFDLENLSSDTDKDLSNDVYKNIAVPWPTFTKIPSLNGARVTFFPSTHTHSNSDLFTFSGGALSRCGRLI